jgi:hypothetical protein
MSNSSFIPQGWASPFFTKEAYGNYLEENDYVHNDRLRSEGQDIFFFFFEDKKILDIGAV